MSTHASHRYPLIALATLAAVLGSLLGVYGAWLILTRDQGDGGREPVGAAALGAALLLVLLVVGVGVALKRTRP